MWKTEKRVWLWLILAIVAGIVIGCHYPPHPPGERILFSFERSTMLQMASGTAERHRVSEHATHGRYALRLRFAPGRETLILDSGGFRIDCSRWRVLRVDVFRPEKPLVLHLRVSDAAGVRRWIWSRRVAPGASTIEYTLADLGKEIDLRSISELMWYAETPTGELYLDAVRLAEPQDAP